MPIEIDYDLLAQKIVECQEATPSDRLLTKKEVLKILGISDITLWRGIKSDLYPKPVRAGLSTRWKKTTVDSYIANL